MSAHQLRFECDQEDGGWSIYLVGRDDPIGEITRAPGGGWRGLMQLEGQTAHLTRDDLQSLIGLFEAFAADGIPIQAEPDLLIRSRIEAEIYLATHGDGYGDGGDGDSDGDGGGDA